MKKIKFVIRPGFEGLEYIEKSLPKESKYFMPSWWKNTPGETSLIKDKPSLIFSFWLIKFPLTSGQLSLSIV